MKNYTLELLTEAHTEPLFTLIENNRAYLRKWMPWVNRMLTLENMEVFIAGTKARNAQGTEYGFVIKSGEEIVGRTGIYKIDLINQIGEIGYWLGEKYQGNGWMTAACKDMLTLGFEQLNLNRIEIKCATQNQKSIAIPQRLGFVQEGILHQAELHPDGFVDLYLFAKCKNQFHNL